MAGEDDLRHVDCQKAKNKKDDFKDTVRPGPFAEKQGGGRDKERKNQYENKINGICREKQTSQCGKPGNQRNGETCAPAGNA